MTEDVSTDKKFDILDYSISLFEKEGVFYSDKLAEISYPSDGNLICSFIENKSFWFKHRNNCIISIIRNFVPDGPIFDIGGGNGFVSSFIEENGFQTVLLEPGPNGISKAQKMGLKRLIGTSFESALFKPGSIPAVGLFDVLEHIDNHVGFLKEIHNSLHSKGYIYLTVPAHTYLWSKDDEYAGHFRRYSKKTLIELFNKAGFSVEYLTYFFSFLTIPIWVKRVLNFSAKNINNQDKIKNRGEDHIINSRLVAKIVETLCRHEVSKIKRNKNIIHGSSIIAVCKKMVN